MRLKRISQNMLILGAYILMVSVNALANILRFNNKTTGDVANAYPNFFTPIPLTFSIWGVIYTLLFFYVLTQLNIIPFLKSPEKSELVRKINIYFILSSIANALWIIAWHYQYIWLSLVFMAIILVSLVRISTRLKMEHLNAKELVLLKLPFSIYYGWITVATIANIIVLLVGFGWYGAFVGESTWTIVFLLLGAGIGIWRMLKDRDVAYGAVFLWAYIGIFVKHTSLRFYAGAYPQIIMTTVFCLACFALVLGRELLSRYRKNRS